MKKALICGVSGQDGGYLGQLLLREGYEVYGTSRDAQSASFHNLKSLQIRESINVESMAPTDFRSVLQVLSKIEPDEIYNLAGQSSVGLSFQQPVETLESIAIGALNLLEAIRFIGMPVKLYNAGSSECFGNTAPGGADETTPFRPRSPYAVAKATAFWEVANYREAYGLFACSGILFNHESPLRPERFVTKKVIASACRIARGSKEKLRLGNISIKRDWGWAPEYVDAMWRMLHQEKAQDIVIATGSAYSLEQLIEETFSCLELDWKDYVVADPDLLRPTDIAFGLGNPAKAKKVLDWEATRDMRSIVRMMVDAEMGRSKAR